MRKRGRAVGDAAGYREKAKGDFDGSCDRCGDEVPWSEIEVHHVDRDRSNDNGDNLETLCISCHTHEHHGQNPLWGIVASMPRPVIEMLDEAVEENGYRSRSEAINRALIEAYDDSEYGYGGPAESVSCWFGDDRHTRWVSDKTIGPDDY